MKQFCFQGNSDSYFNVSGEETHELYNESSFRVSLDYELRCLDGSGVRVCGTWIPEEETWAISVQSLNKSVGLSSQWGFHLTPDWKFCNNQLIVNAPDNVVLTEVVKSDSE